MLLGLRGNRRLAANQSANQMIQGQLAGTVANRDQQQQSPHLMLGQSPGHQIRVGNDGQDIRDVPK